MFRIEHGTITQKIPVIFPNHLVHMEVWRGMMSCLRRHFESAKIVAVSAGEFDVVDCTCHGKSESLGLTSDPDDSNVILIYDYTHGV